MTFDEAEQVVRKYLEYVPTYEEYLKQHLQLLQHAVIPVLPPLPLQLPCPHILSQYVTARLGLQLKLIPGCDS